MKMWSYGFKSMCHCLISKNSLKKLLRCDSISTSSYWGLNPKSLLLTYCSPTCSSLRGTMEVCDELTEMLWDTEDSLLPLSLCRPPITHHDRLSSNVSEMLSDLCLFRGSLDSSSTVTLAERRNAESVNFVSKWMIDQSCLCILIYPGMLHNCLTANTWSNNLFLRCFSNWSEETDFLCLKTHSSKMWSGLWIKKEKQSFEHILYCLQTCVSFNAGIKRAVMSAATCCPHIIITHQQ